MHGGRWRIAAAAALAAVLMACAGAPGGSKPPKGSGQPVPSSEAAPKSAFPSPQNTDPSLDPSHLMAAMGTFATFKI